MDYLFKTDRLIIQKIDSENDILDLLEIYKKKDNLKYLNNSDFEWSLNNLKLKLLLYRKLYKVGLGIYLARLKENNQIVAEVSFFDSFDNIKTPEIGYIIDKKYWNNKFGTEIVTAMVTYLIQDLKVNSIYARMNIENLASNKICTTLGFIEIEKIKLENNITRQTLLLKA